MSSSPKLSSRRPRRTRNTTCLLESSPDPLRYAGHDLDTNHRTSRAQPVWLDRIRVSDPVPPSHIQNFGAARDYLRHDSAYFFWKFAAAEPRADPRSRLLRCHGLRLCLGAPPKSPSTVSPFTRSRKTWWCGASFRTKCRTMVGPPVPPS